MVYCIWCLLFKVSASMPRYDTAHISSNQSALAGYDFIGAARKTTPSDVKRYDSQIALQRCNEEELMYYYYNNTVNPFLQAHMDPPPPRLIHNVKCAWSVVITVASEPNTRKNSVLDNRGEWHERHHDGHAARHRYYWVCLCSIISGIGMRYKNNTTTPSLCHTLFVFRGEAYQHFVLRASFSMTGGGSRDDT